MKIFEFVQSFKDKKVANNKVNEHAVEDYIKATLGVKDYLPFASKRDLCAKVLTACNHIDEDNGMIKVDSVSRYILFTIAILSAYTNLEFSSGEDEEFDSLDEYDMLCQNNLLNPILSIIGDEYASCNNMLNMMMSDIVANNNTMENVFGNAASRLIGIIDGFVDVLSDKVESIDFDLSQLDIDKYKGLIEMLLRK